MTSGQDVDSMTRGLPCAGSAVVFGFFLVACGMRTSMSANSADAHGSNESQGGSAGTSTMVLPPGGSGGATTLAHGSGGSTMLGYGGATTVGHGGSGGSLAGASGGVGGGSVGRGGSITGGTGGRGGSGTGGRGGGSGGQAGTGGTPVIIRDGSADGDARGTPDVATPPPPKIDVNSSYATVNAGTVILSGFITTSAGGSGSSIGLTCTATSFCAAGTVGASSTYNSWANVGFNVNQAQSGASGSLSSLPFVGSSITVSYANKGGSALELLLWDGSNFWCSYLPPSTSPNTINIPFSSLNTKCWDGTGTAFVSGTSVEAVQLSVPGAGATTTAFDFCFLGMTVQ